MLRNRNHADLFPGRSGCVTSAETVLISQQSVDEFLRVLRANVELNGSATALFKAIMVSLLFRNTNWSLSPLRRNHWHHLQKSITFPCLLPTGN